MVFMCVWQRSHLRMETLVRWRLVSIEVNQYERYDGFADTHAVKVFPMSMARAASQRHTVHGRRKITAILDATLACFHKDMYELFHAHPPTETGCCSKLILEQREPHDCGRSIFATKFS